MRSREPFEAQPSQAGTSCSRTASLPGLERQPSRSQDPLSSLYGERCAPHGSLALIAGSWTREEEGGRARASAARQGPRRSSAGIQRTLQLCKGMPRSSARSGGRGRAVEAASSSRAESAHRSPSPALALRGPHACSLNCSNVLAHRPPCRSSPHPPATRHGRRGRPARPLPPTATSTRPEPRQRTPACLLELARHRTRAARA